MDPLTQLGFLPGEYEIRTKGQQLINLLSAIDPAQGIMRGMAASGRAFDPQRSFEERKAAGIEAALETAVPVGMMGIGALAKQPAKAALMDMLTLTGAPDAVVREPGVVARGGEPLDPSRRKFMAGLASLPVAASVAPDILSELGTKAAKVASRGSVNALDSALANVRVSRRALDELSELKDDIQYGEPDEFRNLPSSNRLLIQTTEENIKRKNDIDEAIRSLDQDMRYNDLERRDYVHEALDYLMDDPTLIKGASNDTLEDLVYEIDDDFSIQVRMEEPEFQLVLDEAKARGLHLMKTEEGVDAYPYLASIIEDFSR